MISEKTTIEMKDFRKVNGLLIPYRTVMTIGGGVSKLSPEQEQEMRRGLAEMQKQLEEMPPEQRKMAEKMMKPQMEMMQKALVEVEKSPRLRRQQSTQGFQMTYLMGAS